ncbi:MAG: Dabb family protein, partial [Rhodoglobus sp.]
MIRHSVAFTLRHAPGSAAEADFLAAAEVLGAIPGVERFQKLRETSPKNTHSFVFAMEFTDRASYEAYDRHPDHQE